MKTPSSRRPVLERAKSNKPPFAKTQRDDEILDFIYEFDYADRYQIEKVFFPPDPSRSSTAPSSQCIRRLEGLFHGGYVDRHRYYCTWKEGSYPIIYQCTARGYQEVANLHGVEISDLDIPPKSAITSNKYPHNKRIRDVRVYAMLASRLTNIPLIQWVTDRTLRNTVHDGTVPVTHNGALLTRAWEPDGIFVLEFGNGNRWMYSLEIDMANQSLDVWAIKVKTMIEYRSRRIYEARLNITNHRVLTVTTSEERLRNLKTRTEQEEGMSRFLFTTFDRLNERTVFTEPIWRVASLPDNEYHALNEV